MRGIGHKDTRDRREQAKNKKGEKNQDDTKQNRRRVRGQLRHETQNAGANRNAKDAQAGTWPKNKRNEGGGKADDIKKLFKAVRL